MQESQYASMSKRKFLNTQVRQYASASISEYENTQVCQLIAWSLSGSIWARENWATEN